MATRLFIAFCLLAAATPIHASEQLRWEGAYAGATVSAGKFTNDFQSDFGLLEDDVYDADPEAVGLHAGYGRMLGPVYLGIEANFSVFGDAEASDARQRSFGSTVGSVFGGTVSTSTTVVEAFRTDLRSAGSIKARAGYPVGRLLPFVSAGIAAGDLETDHVWVRASERRPSSGPVTRSIEGEVVTVTGMEFGYAVGGGAELALTPRFSMRAEYSFTDLGERSFALAGNRGEASFEAEFHELKLGASVRF